MVTPQTIVTSLRDFRLRDSAVKRKAASTDVSRGKKLTLYYICVNLFFIKGECIL